MAIPIDGLSQALAVTLKPVRVRARGQRGVFHSLIRWVVSGGARAEQRGKECK
jgi:hypothetical protein